MVDHDKFMSFVGERINEAKAPLMSSGTRNSYGFSQTAERLYKGAENLYFSMGADTFEPVGSMFHAFSSRPGMNDVSNVAAVDIVDIGIQATQQSVMGYLSAERAMDKPIDIAWYQGLVATNDAGGLTKGQNAFNPFNPLNTSLNLGSAVATGDVEAGADVATTDKLIELGKPLVTKGVTLIAKKDDAIVATGTDMKGDGIIYFNSGKACESAVVDYTTGKVTIKGLASTADITKIEAVANIERTGQADGSSTLKVKPKTTTIQLVAKPRRLILENSFEDNAYMNKQAFNMANMGVQMDFGRTAINQLLQSFVFYLNLTSVEATAKVMLKAKGIETLDLTDYLLSSSLASTKNDVVNQYMLRLNKRLLQACGKGPNCYLVCSEGAVVLGNIPQYFVANPAFDQSLDGMIGTYKGLPVVRHHALDGMLDTINSEGVVTEAFAFVGALYKSPDGQAAPTMYAEFLPPYSVVPALNYDNPSQFSQGLFSMSTTEELVPELATYLRIKVTSTLD